MKRYNKFLRFLVCMVIAFFMLPVLQVYCEPAKDVTGLGEREPDAGISITLSVYSGRPNPQWWTAPSDLRYKKMVELIKSLKTQKKPLFDYMQWNRPGYASFWLKFKKVDGMPYAIHIWRDMAYLELNREGEASYAVGAASIYDLLVSQAEEKGQKGFFINYHKLKEKPETGK